MSDVRTVKLKFSDLVFLEDNPRTITREKLERLAERIKKDPTFFENRPCLVNFTDGKYICYAGFQRSHAAAKILKWKEVPCSVENDVPAELMRERAILDNTHDGEWNAHVLANWEFEVPDLIDLGVPEFVFGEGSNVLNSEKLESQEDDYEIPDEIKTDIVAGELFEIGPHRLLCGDSTRSEDVERLVGGAKAEILFTDPPYSSGGFQESGKTSGSIGARGGVKIENDNLSTRGYISLMDKVLGNIKNAHTVFIFCDWKMWSYNQDIAEAKGFRVRNMIVWDKMQMGMGMPFRNQHELCLFGSKVAGKIGNGKTPNVLQFSRDRGAEHVTPKPPELIKKIIEQVLGDLIVDPFIGGGSTMVAAHQLNRRCFGMEIDPKYCQVIVNRMLQIDPTLEIKRNGQPYTKTAI